MSQFTPTIYLIMSDDNTTDDDSSYHPEDDVGSIPSMYELETESIAPIEAAPHDPEPIGLQVVNDNLKIERGEL